ncbi:hypothetical protein BSL78_13444 [Apostichopus japonicus]|uniref:Formimidoyltransferase-cyclodeaminase n=1 Tax=Stichopus japonicus TaxID=307972 RepID=A0A2G8KNY5_STIJA|nr:hypothetical protein BSL78_13444 [Apostichopus japonicus]
MAAKIVECVPNFSEGRRKEVIDAISDAVAKTEGCTLLDVDPGASTNRTVYTFVGPPEAVIEGALNMCKVAYDLIDMRGQHGEHPRMGALDVCPFIPVSGVTMDDCVECAKKFGERLGKELSVPVYLYGFAAQEEKRKKLPSIRAGEYEKMSEKVVSPDWKPDFGPANFVPSWGASATGARKFLIAYNVNVLATKEQCHRIALNVREKGRGPDQPGRLKEVQGIGWWLDEFNIAQISLNLTDMDVTPFHMAFEECKKDAEEYNLSVCGSQIVGLVPLKAILDAADYYIKRDNLFIEAEDQRVRLVVDRLGLSSLQQFNPNERIIEYMVKTKADGPLVSMSLKSFILNVGARSSAPGGGSVAAAVGAVGAGLATMVGWMTYGKRKFENLDPQMRQLIPQLRQAMNDLIPLVDADTSAFDQYMAAAKLPKSTEEEKAIRQQAMQEGMATAINVPMKVIDTASSCWKPLKELAALGNVQCKSDLQVGTKSLELAVWGAYYNVQINLPSIEDGGSLDKTKIVEKIEQSVKTASQEASAILKILDDRKD